MIKRRLILVLLLFNDYGLLLFNMDMMKMIKEFKLDDQAFRIWIAWTYTTICIIFLSSNESYPNVRYIIGLNFLHNSKLNHSIIYTRKKLRSNLKNKRNKDLKKIKILYIPKTLYYFYFIL